MKTTIYYFSATGNGLSIGKKIKTALKDVDLVSIAKLQGKREIITSEKVGFIFPIYAWGVPTIVKEFIKSSEFKNVKYAFSIANCVGIAGKSHLVIKSLLSKKDVKLNAGFILKEPSNGLTIDDDDLMLKLAKKYKGNRIHRSIDERFEEVIGAIKNETTLKLERDAFIFNQISREINRVALKTFKTQDKDFNVNDSCTACKKCLKVCPRKNITMENNKPKWNHDCENCTACINWCPNQSIQLGKSTEGLERYQKEGIDFSEMI